MLLVDSTVLLDDLQDDPQWGDWSTRELRVQAHIHRLAINPVIYAEISLSFSTIEALDGVVARLQLALEEIPGPALFLAGKAFLQYRRRGGSKSQVLPDFFIGAHAAVRNRPLPARDAGRFQTCFPELVVPGPWAAARARRRRRGPPSRRRYRQRPARSPARGSPIRNSSSRIGGGPAACTRPMAANRSSTARKRRRLSASRARA